MLTALAARKAKPREKGYKLADAKGLHLFVTTTGAKSWRFKYRFDGKEKRLTFGLFPEVTITEAREKRDAARRLLQQAGIPLPNQKRRSGLTSERQVPPSPWSQMHGWRIMSHIGRPLTQSASGTGLKETCCGRSASSPFA